MFEMGVSLIYFYVFFLLFHNSFLNLETLTLKQYYYEIKITLFGTALYEYSYFVCTAIIALLYSRRD